MYETITIAPATMRRYRETARRRFADSARLLEERRALAWDVAHEAAKLLRDRFQAREVWVFGSLLREGLFHDRSDVDLAVWGLNQKDILRAVAAVTSLDPDVTVDLVVFEDALESLQETIQSEGRPF